IHDYFSAPGPTKVHSTEMLSAYRRILEKERKGEKTSTVHELNLRLRMRGLISVDRDEHGDAVLRPRNRIFSRIFDLRWVDEQLRARLYFADPLTLWLAHGKSPDLLLKGRQLEQTLAWSKEREQDLPSEERDFLKASQDAEERRRLAEEQAR